MPGPKDKIYKKAKKYYVALLKFKTDQPCTEKNSQFIPLLLLSSAAQSPHKTPETRVGADKGWIGKKWTLTVANQPILE